MHLQQRPVEAYHPTITSSTTRKCCSWCWPWFLALRLLLSLPQPQSPLCEGMEGNTGQNCYYIVCGEALYRTTQLCSRRYYIAPDMSYRNGDAIMSYHMLLYRTRCCYIVTGVLSYRNGDAIMSYHMLLYRTRCCYIVTGVLLYRSSDAVSSYQMLLYRTQCCYIVTGDALSYV